MTRGDDPMNVPTDIGGRAGSPEPEDKLAQVLAEAEVLSKALDFYATERHYAGYPGERWYAPLVIRDGGLRARNALSFAPLSAANAERMRVLERVARAGVRLVDLLSDPQRGEPFHTNAVEMAMMGVIDEARSILGERDVREP